jgi:hypothetical protein
MCAYKFESILSGAQTTLRKGKTGKGRLTDNTLLVREGGFLQKCCSSLVGSNDLQIVSSISRYRTSSFTLKVRLAPFRLPLLDKGRQLKLARIFSEVVPGRLVCTSNAWRFVV